MSGNGDLGVMGRVIKLAEVQRRLHALIEERDATIRELNGHVGVRELARFVGMSPAQVSRIQRGVTQGKAAR